MKDAEIPLSTVLNFYESELQWGRVVKDAEIRSVRVVFLPVAELQWGRVVKDAEILHWIYETIFIRCFNGAAS